jgi:ABC-type phosphate/phosphonate transport system substrate-binding protein
LTALAFCLSLVLTSQPANSEDAGKAAVVRVGVVGSLFRDMPEPMIKAVQLPLKTLMETHTGLTPQVVTGSDAEGLGQQLIDKKVHLGVFHGFEFGWARQKFPELKPLLIAVTKQREFRVCLVVRTDSGITGFPDLQGKSVALPRRSREHCHLFLERRCQGCGQAPKDFLAKLTTPSTTDEALDDVVDGTVQAAVVERPALEGFQDLKPGRGGKLQVAQQSEPFPTGVIAYVPGVLDDATLKRFQQGMIDANRTSDGRRLLTLCQIVGFEKVPAAFDQALTDIVKAYPPPGGEGK